MQYFFPLRRVMRHLLFVLVSIVLALAGAGCGNGTTTGTVSPVPTGTSTSGATVPVSTGTSTTTLPHFDHVVVVIEENHGAAEILGSSTAPYINTLASQGASFTDAHAITHPSEPNYIALFAGSTLGVIGDTCPVNLSGSNLAQELIARSETFTGYSENLPSVGFTGCSDDSGLYARKHNPWVNFSNVPVSANQPFTKFPTDFTKLPTVSFVVPNLENDMHNGPVQQGDTWLKTNLDSYVQWTKAHNSLFILTWDEDDGSSNNNQILTLFVGAHVKAGQYSETINHYNVLSTIENTSGLSYTNNASGSLVIKDIWQ